MTHHIDHQLAHVIGNAEALHYEMHTAIRHLYHDLNDTNGIRAASTNPKLTGTPERLDHPERTAGERQRIDQQINSLTDELGAAVLVLKNIRGECQRIIREHTPPPETPRCDGGTGREGYLVARTEGGWSEPSCSNVPSEGRKTCDTCRQRAARWAREHDIKTGSAA